LLAALREQSDAAFEEPQAYALAPASFSKQRACARQVCAQALVFALLVFSPLVSILLPFKKFFMAQPG